MYGPNDNSNSNSSSNAGNLGTPSSTTNTGPTYDGYTDVKTLLNSVDLTSPIQTFKNFGGLLVGELKNIAKAVEDLDEESSRLVRSLGVSKDRAGELSSTVARAIPQFVEMGMSIGDAGDAYNTLIQSLDTNIMVSDKTLADFAATSKVTGVAQKDLAVKFRDVGVSLSSVGDKMLDVVKIARQAGATVAAVSEGVVNNLDKMNLYNFEGGIKGLASMAAQASRLGIDMSKIFTVVDRVFNPEGAIEFAASLQRLGVTSSQLLDPLRLMDLAQNDPAELQNQIVNMTKEFTRFNKENNQIEILPGAKRRIEEIGKAMGLTGGELQKMAVNAGMFEMKLKQIKFPTDIANKADRELIATMAQIDEKGIAKVQIETKRLDETTGKMVGSGYYTEKNVSDLTEQDVKSLAEQQKGEAESMEKIARSQLDELKKMNGTLGRFITATRYGIASATSEELGYRRTGEVFEKKVKGVLPEFAGETKNWQLGTMDKIKVFSDFLGEIDLSPLTKFTDYVKNITSGTMSMFGMGGRDTTNPNTPITQALSNPNLNISYDPMTITTDNKFTVDFNVTADEKISPQAQQDINKAVSEYFNGSDSRKNMENLLMRIDQIRVSSGQKPIFKK
jgi:hypothetical protein